MSASAVVAKVTRNIERHPAQGSTPAPIDEHYLLVAVTQMARRCASASLLVGIS